MEITTSKPLSLSPGDYDRYKTVLYQGGYQPNVSCSIKSPQSIECEAYESEWVKLTFNVEDFSTDTLEIQRTILATASALDPEDGEWIPLGSKSGPVFAKKCDAAYEIALKAHNTDALQTLLQKHTKPVDGLPGKRFYPGPTDGYSMNAATTFKIKTLTNIVAENRLRDKISRASCRRQQWRSEQLHQDLPKRVEDTTMQRSGCAFYRI
uniref:hypothetical protein n=1 Tax=Pararhizobium sp. IMCC3301 TaxID=3067904 RepID=UPI00274081C9|nr:hypothetical protein [Pararhizobium sp. IMCC3301]